MRLFAIALGLLLAFPINADARPRPRPTHPVKRERVSKQRRPVAIRELPRDESIRDDEDRDDDTPQLHPRTRTTRNGPQSFGLPWSGHLDHATRLQLGDGAYIRRPARAFGTRTAVEFTKRAIEESLEAHPNVHVLAVGDMSAEHGGAVSDHRSHQSGRDIDLGLFYKQKPAGYPNAFIDGTEANLDTPAMYTLISKLAATHEQDGGVWAIFLDYNVQGVIYRWAKNHGISDTKLERIFQYPHGAYASTGVVRHYRNHAHHLHVRFKCTRVETSCG